MWQTIFLLLVVATIASCFVYEQASKELTLIVDETSNAFSVLKKGKLWLQGGKHFVHANGQEYNLTRPSTMSPFNGADLHGTFVGVRLSFVVGSSNAIRVDTTYKIYTRAPMIVFEQYFPQGANNTQASTSFEDLVTAFPRFYNHSGRVPELGYITYKAFWDLYLQGGPGFDDYLTSGMYSSVPLMLYDLDTLESIIISPMNNFKVAFHNRVNGDLACGVQGRVQSLPANYLHQTMIYADTGINQAFENWGNTLLYRYGKQRITNSDLWTSLLGYNTNTGAIYWYHTIPGHNYEETMLLIKKYHTEIDLPIRYYELDSWWYFKEKNATSEHGGIKLYEPRPDVFPRGMRYVQEQLNTPLVVHHKYYAPDTDYQTKFRFLIDKKAAVPLQQEFWQYIMDQVKSWGVMSLIQDWLESLYEMMPLISLDTYLARQYHLQMAEAARGAGVTVQYCLPLVSDIMESLENPAARSVRISDDYSTMPQQWKIGRASVIIHALGMRPIKDTFWTQSVMKDSRYGNFTEPNPELQAIVAIMSTGTVAIGDEIGRTNRTLVMQTCRKDGILLKPDVPMRAIDRSFAKYGPTGEVWTTHADISGIRFHYVFATNLSDPFALEILDLLQRSDNFFQAFEFHTPYTLVQFSPPQSLLLPKDPAKGEQTNPYLYTIAPVFWNKWVLLGETKKFTSVSSQRFSNLQLQDTGFAVTVTGVLQEQVVVRALLSPDNQIFESVCNFASETMIFKCAIDICTCV